MLRLILLPTKA